MKYVLFSDNEQADFLKRIKTKTGLSWNELSKFLGVSRSMIYFYLSEASKLSYESYVRLCNLAGIKIKPIRSIIIKNRTVSIKIPEVSESLSEFIGALAGDGHLNSTQYEVSISMDKDLDKNYSQHILSLYAILFGLKGRISISKKSNGMKCYVYSKELVGFLSKNFKIPVGKKKGVLKIPGLIKDNEVLLKSYLRGLFDTDGSFNRHHKTDAMLSVISRDKDFLDEIKEMFVKLDFHPSVSNKNLCLYRKSEINRFFQEIKPANKKHQLKYHFYNKYGFVPLTSDLIKR